MTNQSWMEALAEQERKRKAALLADVLAKEGVQGAVARGLLPDPRQAHEGELRPIHQPGPGERRGDLPILPELASFSEALDWLGVLPKSRNLPSMKVPSFIRETLNPAPPYSKMNPIPSQVGVRGALETFGPADIPLGGLSSTVRAGVRGVGREVAGAGRLAKSVVKPGTLNALTPEEAAKLGLDTENLAARGQAGLPTAESPSTKGREAAAPDGPEGYNRVLVAQDLGTLGYGKTDIEEMFKELVPDELLATTKASRNVRESRALAQKIRTLGWGGGGENIAATLEKGADKIEASYLTPSAAAPAPERPIPGVGRTTKAAPAAGKVSPNLIESKKLSLAQATKAAREAAQFKAESEAFKQAAGAKAAELPTPAPVPIRYSVHGERGKVFIVDSQRPQIQMGDWKDTPRNRTLLNNRTNELNEGKIPEPAPAIQPSAAATPTGSTRPRTFALVPTQAVVPAAPPAPAQQPSAAAMQMGGPQPIKIDMGVPVYAEGNGFRVYDGKQFGKGYVVAEIGRGEVASYPSIRKALDDFAQRTSAFPTATAPPSPVPVVQPSAAATAQAQPAAAAVAQRAVPQAARLPRDLAGAKPRHNIGRVSYIPDFASDIDKALLIVSQAKRSARDADYLAFLQTHLPGVPETTLRAGQIRQFIKGLVTGKPAGVVPIPDSGIAQRLTGQGTPAPQGAGAGGAPPVKPPVTTGAAGAPLPGARKPNFSAGPRAQPLGPAPRPSPPRAFPSLPGGVFPSGARAVTRDQAVARASAPTPAVHPYLKTEAAITPTGKTVIQRFNETAESVTRALFTTKAPLRKLPVGEMGSPYDLAKVIPGAAHEGGRIIEKEYNPILESVADNLKDLTHYKVIQRNKDLQIVPGRTLPGGNSGWGDILADEAELKRRLGPKKFAEVQRASDALDELNRNEVNNLYQNGLLTRESRNALLTEGEHYFPYGREDFVTGIEHNLNIPTASVSNVGLKHMTEKGSSRALADPLPHLVTAPIRNRRVIARNRAATGLVQSLSALDTLLTEAAIRGDDKTLRKWKDIVGWKRQNGRLVQDTEPSSIAGNINISGGVKPSLPDTENSNVFRSISWIQDGVVHKANIPAYYGRIAQNLDDEVLGGFVTAMRYIVKPFKMSVIDYNPAYFIANLLRDGVSVLFNGGLVPFGPAYLKSLKSVISKDADYIAGSKGGVFLSGLVDNMSNMDAMNRAVKGRTHGAFEIRKPSDVALFAPRLIRNSAREIQNINRLIEQTPRLYSFTKSQAKGELVSRSGALGRDITVDFADAGTVMRTVDAIFPFANPAMQGLYISWQTIKTHPMRSALIAASFTFPTILSRLNNQRFETSDKIPDYEYQNNWVIQFGEYTDENGERQPLRFNIPKGPIAGPATFPAEAVFNVMRKSEDRSLQELLLEGGVGSLKTLSPVDPSAGGVLPPVSTTIQMQANKDFFTGVPIESQTQQGMPPEQRFDERTSKLATGIGQGLTALPGSALDTSPKMVDFALKDYLGGGGATVTYFADLGLQSAGYTPEAFSSALQPEVPKAEKMTKVPVVGRFVKSGGSQLERRGYEQLEAVVESTKRQFNAAAPWANALGIQLGQVGDSLDMDTEKAGGSITLTPQQRAEYQNIMGDVVLNAPRSTKRVSGKLVVTQGLKTYKPVGKTPEEQRADLMKMMDRLREVARDKYREVLVKKGVKRATLPTRTSENNPGNVPVMRPGFQFQAGR